MRILIVCPYLWSRPGGVKTHIQDAARTLVDRGNTCVVLSPDSGNSEPQDGWVYVDCNAPYPGNSLGLYLVHAGRTWNLGGTQIDSTWLDSGTLESLRTFIKQFNPDVIHFHTPWTPFLSVQVLIAVKQLANDGVVKPRFIATFHDTPTESGIGKLIGAFVMPFAARYFMRVFDHVIAVSEPQSRYLTRFSTQKVSIIPNGIHIPSNIDAPSGFFSIKGDYLLFLGRLEHRKGLFEMIRAFEMILQKHPDIGLVIAGDGPLKAEAMEYIRHRKLVNIQLLGRVTEPEKWALLRGAKIYVSPALYGESFGIVLLEAMGVGTPTIGYGNPGYRSIVAGTLDTYFPPPGKTQLLASAIDLLLSDDKLRSDISNTGKKLAQTYQWDQLIEQILNKYMPT